MKLEEYLKKTKLSAADFADKVGVSYQTVYRWMDGSRTPFQYYTQIHRATNGKVTPNDFFQV